MIEQKDTKDQALSRISERLSVIEKELANLQESYRVEKSAREADRNLLVESKDIKQQLQKLEHEAIIAEKQTDYNKVAEIKYAKMPALQKRLEEIDLKIAEKQKTASRINDSVQPEDIAMIISRWTGIPVAKLIQ
jgi:ATP-dependent Clp protease ATP-binding subunit ClpB